MSAIVRDLADAVVATLNAHDGWSQAFTAQRVYVPADDLEDLADLQVQVGTPGKKSEPLTRNSRKEEYTVAVAIQKLVPGKNDPQVDTLVDFAQELEDFLAFKALSTFPTAQWAGCEQNPVYDPVALYEENVFCTVLHFTYKLGR